MGLRTKLRKFLYRQKFKSKKIDFILKNQKILITGANSGIGLAFVNEFLKLENIVYATYKENNDNLVKIKHEKLYLIKCDQRKQGDFDLLEKELLNKEINYIINCAGILGPSVQDIHKFDFNHLKDVMMVNSYSIIKIAQIVLNQKHPLKCIVNISSEGGSIQLNDDALFYIYRTSKSSLNSVTKSLSVILQKEVKGICLAIDPGNMKSGMNPGGYLDANECAKNVINIISNNQKNLNGKFIDLLKNEIPW